RQRQHGLLPARQDRQPALIRFGAGEAHFEANARVMRALTGLTGARAGRRSGRRGRGRGRGGGCALLAAPPAATTAPAIALALVLFVTATAALFVLRAQKYKGSEGEGQNGVSGWETARAADGGQRGQWSAAAAYGGLLALNDELRSAALDELREDRLKVFR